MPIIVGYGPHPRECVELLRQRKIPSVLGNRDLYVLQARNSPAVQEAEDKLRGDTVWAGILHAVAQLRDEDFDWLLELPTFLKLEKRAEAVTRRVAELRFSTPSPALGFGRFRI